MSTETAKTNPETQKTALDVSDLPAELQRVAHAARAAQDMLEGFTAEKERRDRAILAADTAGHPYRAIAAAARRGDGHATIGMVRNAITDYA
ncbi:MAG TPA: hypothetical protein VGS97_26055 [Actinocrinis sp.]|uniref:hypothetical protein n=1 Tax=Actinocrinis sp. TaxID=1920516 RepID=UPI002DDD2CE4|nr:hypothetical protein [Actinocrinis sp.]HEV2347582.1 hypothetical protein [Actinocrinis sp.]